MVWCTQIFLANMVGCTKIFLTKMVWCTQIFLQWWCGARKLFLERWCGAHRFFLQRWWGSHRFFYKAGAAHRFFSQRWCGAQRFFLQSWRGAHRFFLQGWCWLFSHRTHMVPSCRSMWPTNMFQALVQNCSGAEHMAFYKTDEGSSSSKNWIKKWTTTNNIVPPQHIYKTHMLSTKPWVTSPLRLYKKTTFWDL